MACPAILDQAFLSSVLAHIDCQALSLGDNGYHALSGSNSTGGALIVGALTIFIALIGYRLILGDQLGAREIIIAAVKVGMVLMLATSWPAAKTLAYDVVLQGPAQLARQIGNATAIPGIEGDLVDRLQFIDWEFDELDQRGTGVITPAMAGETASGTLRRMDMARDFSWLSLARLVFLTTTIAAMALVRFAGGLLLALTPIFTLFLLFDMLRGLFFGWVRGLIASALGSLFITTALGIELALLEPWLGSVVALRRSTVATPSAPIELLVIALVFMAALTGLLYIAVRVSQGLVEHARGYTPAIASLFRISPSLPMVPIRAMDGRGEASSPAVRSRTLAIADAVARADDISVGRRTFSVVSSKTAQKSAATSQSASNGSPLGQGFKRRTQNRTSASMARRNLS